MSTMTSRGWTFASTGLRPSKQGARFGTRSSSCTGFVVGMTTAANYDKVGNGSLATVGSEEARSRASLRPPLKLHVHISRMQLSRRLTAAEMQLRELIQLS